MYNMQNMHKMYSQYAQYVQHVQYVPVCERNLSIKLFSFAVGLPSSSRISSLKVLKVARGQCDQISTFGRYFLALGAIFDLKIAQKSP
jgi:hypothetical protein